MLTRRINHDEVRSMAATMTPAQIARKVGCHEIYARQIIRGDFKNLDGKSRHAPRPLAGRSTNAIPAFDHPAFMDGRTMYPRTVVEPAAVFKSGYHSSKIGKQIAKGRWNGFPVYTLTLQERATCPKSCKHWRSCFGNTMQMAQRFAHGEALEAAIRAEIANLAQKHRGGFAVRLHVLGDFYSTAYIDMWADLLTKHPPLHAFGFSARCDFGSDPIADALLALVKKRWKRFAIRFSNARLKSHSTVSIEHPYQKPADAVICPQQLGKTNSCSTCALCWQSTRRIAFIQH